MNKRPGQVNVTTEVGYCVSCGRTRNLRREEHQLGTLVRTIVSCETCHRTLSSSIGVAMPEPVKAEAEPETVTAEAPAAKTPAAPKAKPKVAVASGTAKAKTPAKKAPAQKASSKTATRGGKPTSTATRKVTRKK